MKSLVSLVASRVDGGGCNECRAPPNTIALHLRLGDVIDSAVASETCWRAVRTDRGSCRYVASVATVEKSVSPFVDRSRTLLILGDPWYRATGLGHNGSLSLKYVDQVWHEGTEGLRRSFVRSLRLGARYSSRYEARVGSCVCKKISISLET